MKKLILLASLLLIGVPAQAHNRHHRHNHHGHHIPHHHYNTGNHSHCHHHKNKGFSHCHGHSHNGPGAGHHGEKFMHYIWSPNINVWFRF